MTNDLLSWYPTDNLLVTSDLNDIGIQVTSINIFHFFFSLLFVVILIYGIFMLIQLFQKHKIKSHEYLLKKINISQNMTIDFIKINKRLYILASNAHSIELLDVIKQEKEIIEILSENSENLDKKSLNEKFENALKTILKKTDEVESVKKK